MNNNALGNLVIPTEPQAGCAHNQRRVRPVIFVRQSVHHSRTSGDNQRNRRRKCGQIGVGQAVKLGNPPPLRGIPQMGGRHMIKRPVRRRHFDGVRHVTLCDRALPCQSARGRQSAPGQTQTAALSNQLRFRCWSASKTWRLAGAKSARTTLVTFVEEYLTCARNCAQVQERRCYAFILQDGRKAVVKCGGLQLEANTACLALPFRASASHASCSVPRRIQSNDAATTD